MNIGVCQLGQVASQSSASAEQLAASARESSDQVARLREILGGFKTAEG
jgi:methyl-accepting chemotaxis protein